jgi:spore coat polysaccharide biosynthesis protein SpsF
MKFGVIIAARTGSKRLPNKALLPLMGIPMIVFLIRRIITSNLASEIVFATTALEEDERLAEIVKAEGIPVFRGSRDDVLGRYVEAAKSYTFDYTIRVTGDCPFVDGETLDRVLQRCLEIREFDLVTTKPFYPHGIDYEICPNRLLEEIHNTKKLTAEEREHMLNYIYNNEKNYKIYRVQPTDDIRIDETIFLVDTPSDFRRITKLLDGIDNIHIKVSDLIKKYRYENQIF